MCEAASLFDLHFPTNTERCPHADRRLCYRFMRIFVGSLYELRCVVMDPCHSRFMLGSYFGLCVSECHEQEGRFDLSSVRFDLYSVHRGTPPYRNTCVRGSKLMRKLTLEGLSGFLQTKLFAWSLDLLFYILRCKVVLVLLCSPACILFIECL